MQNVPEQYLSIGEASEYLGVSIDTLRRWAKKAKIPAYRSPGHHRYFKKADLDRVFGTRYERSESKSFKTKNIPSGLIEEVLENIPPLEETQIVNEEEKKNTVENPIEKTDNVHFTEEVDFPSAYEEGQINTQQQPINNFANEEKQPLNVPRFIRYQKVSKYDSLLKNMSNSPVLPSPDVSGKLMEKVTEEVSPVVLEKKNFESILVPKIPLSTTAEVKQEPKMEQAQNKSSRIRVEEVLEAPIHSSVRMTSSQQPLDKFLRKMFIAFLVIDAVMFFFWFTSNRLFSPSI